MKKRTLEFRPLPWDFTETPLRYNNGLWTPDDGEYDVCFIGSHDGFPMCYYIDDDNRENILCSWLTGPAQTYHLGHHGGTSWHYALKSGKKDWGESTYSWDSISRKGMTKLCDMRGCANGRGIDFHADEPHIAMGFVRYQDTKKIFRFPKNLKCMYCGGTPYRVMEEAKKKTFERCLEAWNERIEAKIKQVCSRLDRGEK